jgi:hypothetical protein
MSWAGCRSSRRGQNDRPSTLVKSPAGLPLQHTGCFRQDLRATSHRRPPDLARHATPSGAVAARAVREATRRRDGCGAPPPFITHFEEFTMARIGAFCLTTWLAAAILYFGQHSVAMIALSGVVVFGGFDLLRP